MSGPEHGERDGELTGPRVTRQAIINELCTSVSSVIPSRGDFDAVPFCSADVCLAIDNRRCHSDRYD